jgi:hypothetical protein
MLKTLEEEGFALDIDAYNALLTVYINNSDSPGANKVSYFMFLSFCCEYNFLFINYYQIVSWIKEKDLPLNTCFYNNFIRLFVSRFCYALYCFNLIW